MDGRSLSESKERRHFSAFFLWSGLFALHLLFIRSRWIHDIEARQPIIDSLYYLELARLWASGQLVPPDNGLLLLAPGYSLFLIPWVALFGQKLWIILVVQAALGAASLVLLAHLVAEFSGRIGATVAVLLVSFFGPYQLFSASLLSESLIFPVIITFFWLYEKNKWPALQPVLLGFAYLLRPNLGLFVVALLAWLAATDRQKLKTMLWVLPFLVLIPSFHLYTTGSPSGGSAQASVALYLGNHPGSAGLFDNNLGVRGDMHQMAEQVINITEARTGQDFEHPEVNDYWVRQVVSWAKNEPVAFANNVVLKMLRLVDNHEYATDHQWSREFPPLAKFFPIPFALVVSLAAAGLFGSFKRRWAVYLLYLGTGIAGLLIYYPSSRHRFVLLPVLAIFAARGVISIVKRRSLVAVVVCSVGLLSFVGVRDDRRTEDPYVLFNRAYGFLRDGNLNQAEHFLDLAMRGRSDVPFFHTLRAEIMEARGLHQDSKQSLRVAFLLGENDSGVINRVAGDALDRRQWHFAEQVFRRSLELHPESSTGWSNLAQVLLAQGRQSEALEAYNNAINRGASRRPDMERLMVLQLP